MLYPRNRPGIILYYPRQPSSNSVPIEPCCPAGVQAGFSKLLPHLGEVGKAHQRKSRKCNNPPASAEGA